MAASCSARVFQSIAIGIKRQIATGKLLPGEKLLPEREMARRRHVSRVSVRDAYRSLEELGVIAIRRGSDGGAYVTEPHHTAIQRSLSLMLRLSNTSNSELSDAWMIELTIARLAARHGQPKDLARLQRALKREEASIARGGHAGAHAMQFLRAVADCARNLPLTALMYCLADLTLESLSSTGSELSVRMCEAHQAIFQAIARHDEQAASQLMREHIACIQSAILANPARPLPSNAPRIRMSPRRAIAQPAA